MGSAYEFNNTRDTGFDLFPEGASYTDDSVMTAALAKWLMEDPGLSLQGLEDCMVRFGDAYPDPKGGYGGNFSDWLFCPDLLRLYGLVSAETPYGSSTGRRPYVSWGNGSAMRVSPVGWWFDTLQETEGVAAVSASITRNHPEGIKGAQATAAAVFLARTGKSKDEIRDYLEKAYGYDLHQSWEHWHANYGWDDSCQGTVPQAVIAFLASDSFEDAIRRAVALGGDSDTLACITGGIAEAYYGGVPGHLAGPTLSRLDGGLVEVLDAFRKQCPSYRDRCRPAPVDGD